MVYQSEKKLLRVNSLYLLLTLARMITGKTFAWLNLNPMKLLIICRKLLHNRFMKNILFKVCVLIYTLGIFINFIE